VGVKSGVRAFCKRLFVAAVATSLLLPATAFAKPAARKQHTKITVHPKHHWRGYGFLPGYRTPEKIAAQRSRGYEMRYWYNGQILYGWGEPRFYRGRWNSGSFGPCWVSTPIGMMPTCGP